MKRFITMLLTLTLSLPDSLTKQIRERVWSQIAK